MGTVLFYSELSCSSVSSNPYSEGFGVSAGGAIVGVFFTLTNRALYPVIYVVANPVHGLLDRERSEEYLQSYNENMKTKTKQKTREQQPKAHARKR